MQVRALSPAPRIIKMKEKYKATDALMDELKDLKEARRLLYSLYYNIDYKYKDKVMNGLPKRLRQDLEYYFEFDDSE